MDAIVARIQASVIVKSKLSWWKKATQYIHRPWHCSTTVVLRRLDARQSHAEHLKYRAHFYVRILSIEGSNEWNVNYGTAYVPVSAWLYENYERCNFLIIKYKTSRYVAPEEFIGGRGIKAKLAT